MDVFAKIKDGRIVLSREQLSLRDSYARKLKDGTEIKITLTRLGRDKTQQQLGAFFGLLIRTILNEFTDRGIDLATFLNSDRIPLGLPVPVDVLKEYLYAVAGDVGENGERKRLSTPMSTVEASRFFEKCRDYAASAWHIVVPDPNPMWRQIKEAPTHV